jgi:hypothetical protein
MFRIIISYFIVTKQIFLEALDLMFPSLYRRIGITKIEYTWKITDNYKFKSRKSLKDLKREMKWNY